LCHTDAVNLKFLSVSAVPASTSQPNGLRERKQEDQSMNPAAFQAMMAPPPLADQPPADTSFGRHLAQQATQVETIDAAAGDPGRLASPGALANEVLQSLRGFMQRADAMTKSSWNKSGGHHDGHGSPSVSHLHAGPAQASLDRASYEPPDSSELKKAGEGAEPSADNPLDYFDDIVKQSLEDFSFYVQAEMLSHSAMSLGHTANTLAKGQ
jgi:hypothetical protein